MAKRAIKPCDTCHRKFRCGGMCDDYRAWFKVEWPFICNRIKRHANPQKKTNAGGES